jgi:hypothetical protein
MIVIFLGDNLRLEPIGFMFLIFFVSIMMLQTFGMLMHRAGTMMHSVATTVLQCEKRKSLEDANFLFFDCPLDQDKYIDLYDIVTEITEITLSVILHGDPHFQKDGKQNQRQRKLLTKCSHLSRK